MRRVHGKVRSGWIRIVTASATLGLVVALTPTARAQTPDGETPANEGVCDELIGATPGLYGLCVGFCEAQDCEASIDASTGEVTFDADCKPSDPKLLANYNNRAGPDDPPMPCVNDTITECPCWTEAELDGFSMAGDVSCGLTIPHILTVMSGTQPEFHSATAYAAGGCLFVDTRESPTLVRDMDITDDDYIICRESIEAECADRGNPLP
jgi:hypothetical protein